MGYKMSGFSGFGNSPIKQDDKKKCYINEKGESVCPYAPMAPETPEVRKKYKTISSESINLGKLVKKKKDKTK